MVTTAEISHTVCVHWDQLSIAQNTDNFCKKI